MKDPCEECIDKALCWKFHRKDVYKARKKGHCCDRMTDWGDDDEMQN